MKPEYLNAALDLAGVDERIQVTDDDTLSFGGMTKDEAIRALLQGIVDVYHKLPYEVIWALTETEEKSTT